MRYTASRRTRSAPLPPSGRRDDGGTRPRPRRSTQSRRRSPAGRRSRRPALRDDRRALHLPVQHARARAGALRPDRRARQLGGTVVASSAEVRLMCDNRAPTILNSLPGRRTTAARGRHCRPTARSSAKRCPPQDVTLRSPWNVMAPSARQPAGALSITNISRRGAVRPARRPCSIRSARQRLTGMRMRGDNAVTYVATYRLAAGNAEGNLRLRLPRLLAEAFSPVGTWRLWSN